MIVKRFTLATVTTVLVVLLVPGLGSAQDCDDYSQYTHWVARGDFNGEAGGIDIVGSYAYVCNQQVLGVGIEIFDISDPYHLVSVGSTPYPGEKRDIAVEDDRAYVVSAAGLEVINVQDPKDPFVVGSVGTPGSPRRVAVSGDYAYVADWDSGLVVVDVSVDSLPAVVGSIAFTNRVDDVAIQGDYAYLSNFSNLQIVDISNPAAPSLVGTLTISGGYAVSVGVSGSYAYLGRVSTNRGFYVADVSNPYAPVLVGDIQGMNVYEFVVDGPLAYLCSGDFRIIDVSNPSAPQELVRVPTGGDDVAISGGYAFLGGGNVVIPDVQVVDLGVHETPTPVGEYTGLSLVLRIDVEGGLAYALGTIGGNNWELHSLDMSMPSSPQVLDSLTIENGTFDRGMDIDGGTVVFVMGDDLWIVDASTPSAMSVVSATPLDCCASDIKVEGSHVYITRSDGLRVFDISSPLTPAEVGSITLYGTGSLDVVGSLVYLANDANGIQVVDVSTPSSPTPRGALSGYYFQFVTVRDNYAYAAGYYNFAVVDISDPDAPTVVASRGLPGDAHGISEGDGVVSVGLHTAQVQLFDVSSPSSPIAIGNTGGVYPSYGLEVDAYEGVIVVAAGEAGVEVFPGQCLQASSAGNAAPSSPDASLSVWPNPFNPAATIRLEIPRESRVTLRIYDVSGRLVRTLVEGRRDARVHEVTWDGTDDSGRRVTSGVYFCRLTAGTSVQVRKAVLLK
jgi:hypothetical protein